MTGTHNIAGKLVTLIQLAGIRDLHRADLEQWTGTGEIYGTTYHRTISPVRSNTCTPVSKK